MKISLDKVEIFALKSYNEVNKLYDGKPYSVHINGCIDVANKFIHLIPYDERDVVIAAIYCHDVLEDCHTVSYNDLKKEFGSVALCEIVYAVTNLRGRSRKDRANHEYYTGIRNTPYAIFVKLCDRIANIEYSKTTGSRMFEMYKGENNHSIEQLNHQANTYYYEMFDYLNKLING